MNTHVANVGAPDSEAALVLRARQLSGRTLAEIAADFDWQLPHDLRRKKGWVGQLLEVCLGADGRSRARPDFEALGVELKSIPVDRSGRPTESTFVCSILPSELLNVDWPGSRARLKLKRVLWVPVEATGPLAARRIGAPLLWSPSDDEERALRKDWDRFSALCADGYLDAVGGELGEVLQIRPKAKNARARRLMPDAEGGSALGLPRGFYLRARFTAEILAKHFLLPHP